MDGMQLSPDQQHAMNLLLFSNDNLFISGQAGTGKSFLIRNYIQQARKKYSVALTSTTGVSALLIGGNTIHSYLGLGLGQYAVNVMEKMIRRRKKILNRWETLNVLVIDEISMMHPDLFLKIHLLATSIRREYLKPFGGIRLVLLGDFLQLPSVGGESFLFETTTWKNSKLHVVQLTTNMRQIDDEKYSRILAEIRQGVVTLEAKSLLQSRLIKNLIPNQLDSTTTDVSSTGVHADGSIVIDGITPTRVFCTNNDVDRVNHAEFMKLDTKILERKATISLNHEHKDVIAGYITEEEILKKSRLADLIFLRAGAQVMLLRNMDVAEGLVNGSRGVVKSIVGDIVYVKFLNHIEIVPIAPVLQVVEQDEVSLGSVMQYPLRLAYAATIHKLQGSTLDFAIMNLRNVFEYSQSYVALSRVKNLKALFLEDISFKKIQCHPKALNYYHQLEQEEKK
jgi:ATP-dependent DNA helicase PIF1